MFVVFTTAADGPQTGTGLCSVTAWSADGKTGYQRGSKFLNGREPANFVYNITNGADRTVSTRSPLATRGLGDEFGGTGTVTVDGTDVDRYPDGEDKTQFPGN